jgi:hypothetical protein
VPGGLQRELELAARPGQLQRGNERNVKQKKF